jgi:DNA-binding NtrC family response regulator
MVSDCFCFELLLLMSCRIHVTESPFTVFVVDDDKSVLASLKLLLESSGYRVGTFSSAEDFLLTARVEKTLLSYTRHPSAWMSGFELQEHLLESQAPVPIIFTTGHDSNPRKPPEAERWAKFYSHYIPTMIKG